MIGLTATHDYGLIATHVSGLITNSPCRNLVIPSKSLQGKRVKVWVRSVGFHERENAQFNLANHRLATRLVIER